MPTMKLFVIHPMSEGHTYPLLLHSPKKVSQESNRAFVPLQASDSCLLENLDLSLKVLLSSYFVGLGNTCASETYTEI